MEIRIGSICGQYQEAIFSDGTTTTATGALDDNQARQLAYRLLVAAEELLVGSGGDVYNLDEIHNHLNDHL